MIFPLLGGNVDVAKFQIVYWLPFWNRKSDFRFFCTSFFGVLYQWLKFQRKIPSEKYVSDVGSPPLWRLTGVRKTLTTEVLKKKHSLSLQAVIRILEHKILSCWTFISISLKCYWKLRYSLRLCAVIKKSTFVATTVFITFNAALFHPFL